MHHVIVGNGITGMEAALAVRAREPSAEITLISYEHPHFFSRTALMYVLAGQLSLRDTEPYDRDLYLRLRLRRIHARVLRLEPGERRLILSEGPPVSYDRLLLAVGSKARPAPWKSAEGPGVFTFVTLQDLQGLSTAVKPGARAVVVGGGLIGVEVAEVLKLRGVHTTFIIREPTYFPVALDEAEAAVVARHIRNHGVDVRLGAQVDDLERAPDGRLTGVRLVGPGSEVIPADLVVVAIGVVPNTTFLRDSGIVLADSGAIEVDDQLRTNLPDVWAAGDCANVTWVDGSRRPEQLWYTGRDQGRVAARGMLGDEVRYRRGTWYNSAKFFDLEYTTAGFLPYPSGSLPPGYRSWYQEGALAGGQPVTQRIVVKDGRVVGFNTLGSRWDHNVWLRWIHDRRSLDYVLAHMNESRFDEEFMSAFVVLPTATLTGTG